MRNTKINIHGTSQKERIKLYDHLISLGETIYSDTGLRGKEYSCRVFDYETSTSQWSGGGSANLKDAISIDAFIEKYPVTTQESEEDYAIICKDSSIEDRNLIYLHLENLNYKMYKHTNFITIQNYTSSDTVYSYDKEQWQTDCRKSITTHIKLISVKDFIAKFIKTSEQSPPTQDSSVQIGQKYKNSVGTINIITRITSTNVAYKPENDSREYTCTIANVKKNWKLLPEAEIASTYNLQYVDNSGYTGFVSESFIDNEVATTTLATVPIGTASLVVASAASTVSIKKFDGVIGTPLGGTNQPTIKREKKSMAKAIKDAAIATLDQNKQAAIIAGKMEAGRILNKQVIKQIKPHIPMFVRGYLDTTLAPVVVANLVAAIGNHTQNKRVQQVSELMLLAAADTTVQSFNLDKIIDDVLAGVKLPAGILDTHEE